MDVKRLDDEAVQNIMRKQAKERLEIAAREAERAAVHARNMTKASVPGSVRRRMQRSSEARNG